MLTEEYPARQHVQSSSDRRVEAVGPPTNDHAIDDAIRSIPISWFAPAPAIYRVDLLIAAAVGWTTLGLAIMAHGWRRAALLAVVILAFYRAVLFIHEITHRAGRAVPAFRLVWNAIVGVPLLIPSFLYEGVHTDHHRQSCYGTEGDPEYMPFGRRSPLLILAAVLGSLLAPVALALRFGILAPLSWLVPGLRRPVAERCSALAINGKYRRRVPISAAGRVQEVAAFAVFWIAIAMWRAGILPGAALSCWFIASASVSGINAIRTLAAHRYDHDAGELSMTDQLLDSCTIATVGGLTARLANSARVFVAPVGLRYHALHHWIPSLPYHNLGRAHRLLVATLKADAPYHATLADGLVPPLRDLLRRSRTQSHR